jgi:YfiH family protein
MAENGESDPALGCSGAVATSLITPRWPAPATVRAASTTRIGGRSRAPYDELNLGERSGDDPDTVSANRAALSRLLELPAEPFWLHQVHGARVVDAGTAGAGPEADAAIASRPGAVCAVLTADCLPVLLCDARGTRVGAVHAGWRGMAQGVIEAAVAHLGGGAELLAWLGPAIGPGAYEVGPEVRAALCAGLERAAQVAFSPSPSPAGRWMADLYTLARLRLRKAGVDSIHGGAHCTFSEADRFYSYRRDGPTGRMASLVWLVS